MWWRFIIYCHVLSWITSCQCIRRIFPGIVSYSDKPYIVYIIQSSQSIKQYDAWLCGGCLISEDQVLTSAACLYDVSHVYVIAGYRQYINYIDVDENECTRRQKRRVMSFKTPAVYNFSYTNVTQWLNFDVAVATVDKPYDFSDKSYRLDCSYTPQAISVSYDQFHTNYGTPVHMSGWGHVHAQRRPSDAEDDYIKYMRVLNGQLQDKQICKNTLSKYKGLGEIIDKWMLCISGDHNSDFILNTNRHTDVDPTQVRKFGCDAVKKLRRMFLNDSVINCDTPGDNVEYNDIQTTNDTRIVPIRLQTRRMPRLCQDNHGVPLVTWEGNHEVVIGIGLTAIITGDLRCQAPSLFLSTYCLGMILECLITKDDDKQKMCAYTKQVYQSIETIVEWVDVKYDIEEVNEPHNLDPIDIPQVIQSDHASFASQFVSFDNSHLMEPIEIGPRDDINKIPVPPNSNEVTLDELIGHIPIVSQIEADTSLDVAPIQQRDESIEKLIVTPNAIQEKKSQHSDKDTQKDLIKGDHLQLKHPSQKDDDDVFPQVLQHEGDESPHELQHGDDESQQEAQYENDKLLENETPEPSLEDDSFQQAEQIEEYSPLQDKEPKDNLSNVDELSEEYTLQQNTQPTELASQHSKQREVVKSQQDIIQHKNKVSHHTKQRIVGKSQQDTEHVVKVSQIILEDYKSQQATQHEETASHDITQREENKYIEDKQRAVNTSHQNIQREDNRSLQDEKYEEKLSNPIILLLGDASEQDTKPEDASQQYIHEGDGTQQDMEYEEISNTNIQQSDEASEQDTKTEEETSQQHIHHEDGIQQDMEYVENISNTNKQQSDDALAQNAKPEEDTSQRIKQQVENIYEQDTKFEEKSKHPNKQDRENKEKATQHSRQRIEGKYRQDIEHKKVIPHLNKQQRHEETSQQNTQYENDKSQEYIHDLNNTFHQFIQREHDTSQSHELNLTHQHKQYEDFKPPQHEENKSQTENDVVVLDQLQEGQQDEQTEPANLYDESPQNVMNQNIPEVVSIRKQLMKLLKSPTIYVGPVVL